MYQGGGGSGQGPGRNPTRTTGTIPRNNGSSDASLLFRHNQPPSQNIRVPAFTCSGSLFPQKPSTLNAPKNQAPLSWSATENISPRAVHKNGPSNFCLDQCGPAPDVSDPWRSGVANNSHSLTGVRSLGQVHEDSEANGYLEATSLPPFDRSRVNGCELALSSTSSCSSQVNNEACRNEIHLEHSRQCEPKKRNNIPIMNCSMDPSSSRSLQSPSLTVGQPASMPMSKVSINGQGDAVNKSSEFNNRNELKLKLEEEERKLHALQEKQSVLLRRRNRMLSSPFESHRPEDSGQGEVLQRERAVDGRPSDPNRSRLESELHSLQLNGHFVGDEMELRDGESSEDSAVEDSYDDYMEAHTRAQVQGQIVRDKLAEINCLRAQLKQVKGLISMAQRSPGSSVRSESSCTANAPSDFAPSEQVVNIRRQRSQANINADERQSQTVGNERSIANRRPDSKQSNASTKAEELEHGKARLRHLQALIARVQEFHSANLPIPEYLLAELKSETEEGSSPRQNCNSVSESGRLPGERPGSPSIQNGVGEDFIGDNDDVDNDENAFAARHPEQNELLSSHQASFSQEQNNAPSRRAKTVNVGGEFDQEFDVTSSRGDVFMKFERPVEVSFRRATGPSTTWENGTSSTPQTNEDGPVHVNVETNEAELLRHSATRDHDCGCHQHHQRQYQQPDSQLQDFQDCDNMQPRAQQINPNNASSLPDVTVRGVWSSIPESEDISSSTNHPMDSRYQGIRQDNNSVSSSTVNIFSHAQEVQNRLRTLAQSYQGLLTDGHMEVLPGNRPDQIYAAMMSNLPPSVNIPPPASVGTNNCDREHYYQQLFAASQLQYQQVLVTAVNQCYQLLWLQHQELSNLRSTVHMLTTNAAQMSGLAQGQEPWGISPPSPAPVPPTLNNQVPPGNRTNNYWDNFRSYSRQNLLSARQAKSNEVFPHNPSPLAERSHNALHPPSNPVPTVPITHLATGSVTSASAMPMLSPLSGTPGQSASMGAIEPSLTSTSFGPLPPTSSHHPESLDIDGGVAAASDSTHICRKDKRNLAYQGHQNQQARNDCNDANRQSEISSSVCDGLPVLPTQENSPLDAEIPVPMPMPFLRSHLLYHRLSNPLTEYPGDIANRCADATRSRNQMNSVPSMTGEVHPTQNENINDSNHGRMRDGTNGNPRHNDGGPTWIGRRNWNNTSWTPNFQPDATAQSAVSMPDFRFNNVSVPESQSGTIKRNSCIQKRSSSSFAPVNQTNYQRNIHGFNASSPAIPLQLPNRSRNIPTAAYQHHNSLANSTNECETHSKLSKNQPGFDSSRNILSNQRSEAQARGLVGPSNRTDQSESAEQEDQPLRCNSARHQATLSESDLQSCEMSKNHMKENRLQMSKSPKYNSKPVTPGSQTGAPSPHGNIRAVSKSNQAGGISKRNQDSAKPSSSTQNYPEDVREAVLAEVASLMSANENQPQFLAQLLRSLQLLSSDNQMENASQVVHSNAEMQQNEEATSIVQGEVVQEEEVHAVKDTKLRRGRRSTPPKERIANSSHSTYDRACSLPECETRGTEPNDTGDKFKDFAVELSSYFRAHLHDTCTSSMIEEICGLVLMFVPFARNSHASGRTNPFQLEGLLENALLRFQGRRLEVVCDEITSVIVKVLTNELSFVHLIDAMDQNIHQETVAEANVPDSAQHGWLYNEGGAAAAPAVSAPTVSAPAPSATATAESASSPPVMREPDDVELLEIGLVSELASNGDLAEADQSHSSSLANGEGILNRSLGHRPDVAEMEDEDLEPMRGAAAVEENVARVPADSRPLSCEPSREHESVPDRGPSESVKSVPNAREQNETSENYGAVALPSQEWEESSEEYQMPPQGIDHGLDQVPIRLAGDQHSNQTGPSSDSTQ